MCVPQASKSRETPLLLLILSRIFYFFLVGLSLLMTRVCLFCSWTQSGSSPGPGAQAGTLSAPTTAVPWQWVARWLPGETLWQDSCLCLHLWNGSKRSGGIKSSVFRAQTSLCVCVTERGKFRLGEHRDKSKSCKYSAVCGRAKAPIFFKHSYLKKSIPVPG